MEQRPMQVQPGRSVGFMTLGCSLHDTLAAVKADVRAFPRFHLCYDDRRPIASPVHLVLPANGLRLQFDGPDQRLRLIEVVDFTRARLAYKDIDVFKTADTRAAFSHAPQGPSFRHVYDKLLGPTYSGEYLPPRTDGPSASGTYSLSYPGIAFNFPVQHTAYLPKKDFISLLSSSATGPATSMAVFHGESWQEARRTLFTAPPPNPRSIALAAKAKEGGPDEIEHVKIHGQGRLEFLRRSGPAFWLTLSETTPQDLIMHLGPPDAIHRKIDRRLSIHKDRRPSDASSLSLSLSPTSAVDDSDSAALEAQERDVAAAEHFFNYFHHGFDILISQPTSISAPSPSVHHHQTVPHDQSRLTAQPLHHLTATKILLHGNVPGSYQFNRHRRSRWTLEHVPSATYREPLTSEMTFADISGRLKDVFKAHYENVEQERLQQRGMALNRGWGDSPGSSCELIGGWDEGPGNTSWVADSEGGIKVGAIDGSTDVGKVDLFGFPGMIFEVLKNGAVTCLTIF